jgi:hypothetical protein
MAHDPARLTFRRVALGDDTAWNVVSESCVIARVMRVPSFGRAYSKSQMGTRHIMVWQSSVDDVPGLSDDERRAVQRELRSRDKTTRKMAAAHILASYERANIQLPAVPARRAA